MCSTLDACWTRVCPLNQLPRSSRPCIVNMDGRDAQLQGGAMVMTSCLQLTYGKKTYMQAYNHYFTILCVMHNMQQGRVTYENPGAIYQKITSITRYTVLTAIYDKRVSCASTASTGHHLLWEHGELLDCCSCKLHIA